MSSSVIFQCFLTLHLLGFALFVGITITDFITFRQFRKQYEQAPDDAKPLLQAISKFPPLMGVAVLLTILAGIGMMSMVHGVYGTQVWLRIKVPLVIIAALNGIIVRRRQGAKLQKLTAATVTGQDSGINKVSSSLRIFYTVQFILCFTIVLLSAFKFN